MNLGIIFHFEIQCHNRQSASNISPFMPNMPNMPKAGLSDVTNIKQRGGEVKQL